jgi:hypothetical protein
MALPTIIRLAWKGLVIDKHSSLLGTFENYGRKGFLIGLLTGTFLIFSLLGPML